MAFGACMPIVCTPVGGMVDQVVDGKTGVLATSVTATAFADAIRRLAEDQGLCVEISGYLRQTSSDRSMMRFLNEIIAESSVGERRSMTNRA
jgi:glycosyltransferase involved in cell wall biosynthesis